MKTLLLMLFLLQVEPGGGTDGIGGGALVFMLVSMGAVITLTVWCFRRIIQTRKHLDPDGTGPDRPPVPGKYDRRGR